MERPEDPQTACAQICPAYKNRAGHIVDSDRRTCHSVLDSGTACAVCRYEHLTGHFKRAVLCRHTANRRFNTTDIASLSQSSQLLTIVLMFIGGCPGSTAGGAKVTTVAVLILYLRSVLTRTDGVNIFKRRLENEAVAKAAAVFTTNMLLAVVATFLISALQDLDLTMIVFDVVSAISTVGMSTGITPYLVPGAKVILILLMYLGRVGGLSFAMSFTDKKRLAHVRQPKEHISVG